MSPNRRLPAEWEAQSGVLLVWPDARTDWVNHLAEVAAVYTRIASLIGSRQPLLVACRQPADASTVRSCLLDVGIPADRLSLLCVPFNDTWVRDFGPLTITTRHSARLKDFRFNGWGGQYPFDLDTGFTARLVQTGALGNRDPEPVNMVLEGGAIETDGLGSLMATHRSIVDPARNPGMTRQMAESRLTNELGIQRFLWLDHGAISGDDTGGHIDMLARFCDPESIVYSTALKTDPDRGGLGALAGELSRLRTWENKPYRLIPLPPIKPIWDKSGRRLPASYANFLIINEAVLVPVYDDVSDRDALEVLGNCFPHRQILPVNCLPLIRENGSLHCITLQFPQAIELPILSPENP
ncbi:MAG: agmatine deiminase family protein [Gammaproteobacteria bacterium]|nr:agmatine deiminase family protein [Gammaproteobacteria bacterium]